MKLLELPPKPTPSSNIKFDSRFAGKSTPSTARINRTPTGSLTPIQSAFLARSAARSKRDDALRGLMERRQATTDKRIAANKEIAVAMIADNKEADDNCSADIMAILAALHESGQEETREWSELFPSADAKVVVASGEPEAQFFDTNEQEHDG